MAYGISYIWDRISSGMGDIFFHVNGKYGMCIGCLIFYFGYREYIFVVCLFGGMDGENGLL